jgi:hypothetical protein
MVNRTLRRPRKQLDNSDSGVIITTRIEPDSDGSVTNTVDESTGAESTDDNVSNGDVKDDTEQPDGPSGNDVVEIDPAKLGEFIDNGGTTGSDSDSDGTGERKRRKPRGPNKSKAQATNLEPVLMMAHTWAAVLLKTPEIGIDKDEAKQISDAYVEFCKYHTVPVLTPKRMSEINMLGALGIVYGPRIMAAVRNRKKKPALVTQMPVSGTR